MEYYFDNSLFGCAIKNRESRYVYANQLACRYFGMPLSKLSGCLDTDFIPDICDYYVTILNDDRRVLNSRVMSIAIKTFDYGRQNRLRSFRGRKATLGS